jgi:hypothetical protein
LLDDRQRHRAADFREYARYSGRNVPTSIPAIGIRTVQTPANVILPKSKHNVAVSCTAQCYSPGVGTLGSHTEVMAAGNVLFGGIIGLGVDAASGAMNTYDSSVEVIMTPMPAAKGQGRADGEHAGVTARLGWAGERCAFRFMAA